MSTICMFYMRGSCRFGERCWNSHDLGTARSDSPFRQSETTDDEESFHRSTSPTQTASPPVTSRITKQKNQTSTNVAQISQKSENIIPESKWILKNINSGEERVGTPDSTLVEVVKKLNEAENLVISLTQQLRNRNDDDKFSWIEHQMEQCIDSDLQCNICYEIFIKPTVLNCSHTFCQECIDSWTRRVNHCPTCRVYVKKKSYCLTLDTFLDKITDCLPGDVKLRRESLKVERNNNRAETSRNRRNNIRRRNNRQQSIRQRLDVIWGERDREGVDWNSAIEEALFDPIRLGDVIGRNRNDGDLWDEELSDSSLDSSYEHGYICSFCDEIHSSSNCPLSMEESWLQ